MTSELFRFLHISDLHLCKEVNRRNLQSLLKFTPSRYLDVANSAYSYGLRSLMHPASYKSGALNALSEFLHDRPNAYDAIILSGDVSTSGSPIDHNIAFEYVDKAPTAKWRSKEGPVLCRGATPVIVCPGNHDNYSTSNSNPNAMAFALRFGKYMPHYGLNRVGYQIFAEGQNALALIYGDFGFQTRSDARNRLHLMGGGKVHSNVLNDLVALTKRFKANQQLKDYKKSVIWMIHFAPFQCQWSFLELTDRHKVMAAAAQNGVKNILCGHTHERSEHKAGGVTVFCSGSASSVECQNEIHEIVFDINSETISRKDFSWSRQEGAFV